MPAAADRRIHSTVFHKRDWRVNAIVRRCRKSEIISLYNIDCCVLFRVEQAHVLFDMLQNCRPYIQFDGRAEGVFLPARTGLLFPNACDQLDFREDFPVQVSMAYALSDVEIGTLANNGLFNNDWSCQGRIIGSLLEIPCRVDYSAIANTPITFIEIQDRLSLQTSTLKTGYRTLVTAFLPYSAQKHNEEQHARLTTVTPFDRDSSEIRKRSMYDSKPVSFEPEVSTRTTEDGASFVEVAQARIQNRLKEQMSRANILNVEAGKTSDFVVDAIRTIQTQTEDARKKAENDALEAGHTLESSVLDARLHDMAEGMVYAGAKEIPLERPAVDVQTLASSAPEPDSSKTSAPVVRLGHDRLENPAGSVEDLDDRVHRAAQDAQKDAASIVASVKHTMNRRSRLAARQGERESREKKMNEAMRSAGAAEAAQGMDRRAPDVTVRTTDPETGKESVKAPVKKSLAGDILTSDVDLDELIRNVEGQ